MISLKMFLLLLFLFTADWSDFIPESFIRRLQKVPVKSNTHQRLR